MDAKSERHVWAPSSGNGSRLQGTPRAISFSIALAVQQPFPNLIYRADLSILYDLEGGVFVQPGVKWRPRDNFQLDVMNIMDSDGSNDDIMGTLETQDEIFARLSFYFDWDLKLIVARLTAGHFIS